MTAFILIILAIVIVAGIFDLDNDTPKNRTHRPRRRRSEPRRLPWMDPNYKKRKKREKRNSSKLGF